MKGSENRKEKTEGITMRRREEGNRDYKIGDTMRKKRIPEIEREKRKEMKQKKERDMLKERESVCMYMSVFLCPYAYLNSLKFLNLEALKMQEFVHGCVSE